jgi:hypothetical protein
MRSRYQNRLRRFQDPDSTPVLTVEAPAEASLRTVPEPSSNRRCPRFGMAVLAAHVRGGAAGRRRVGRSSWHVRRLEMPRTRLLLERPPLRCWNGSLLATGGHAPGTTNGSSWPGGSTGAIPTALTRSAGWTPLRSRPSSLSSRRPGAPRTPSSGGSQPSPRSTAGACVSASLTETRSS